MDDEIDVFEETRYVPEVEGGDEDYNDYEDYNPNEYNSSMMDSSERKPSSRWHLTLIIAIIVALVLIYYRENFALPMPSAISSLPYSGGASIRSMSIDSATDRGNV